MHESIRRRALTENGARCGRSQIASIFSCTGIFVLFVSSVVASSPSVPGQIIGAVVEEFGEDVVPRLLGAAKHAPNTVETVASILRASPGRVIIKASVLDATKPLREKERVARFTSLGVAKKQEVREFASFGQY